jgi:hypothetical protein
MAKATWTTKVFLQNVASDAVMLRVNKVLTTFAQDDWHFLLVEEGPFVTIALTSAAPGVVKRVLVGTRLELFSPTLSALGLTLQGEPGYSEELRLEHFYGPPNYAECALHAPSAPDEIVRVGIGERTVSVTPAMLVTFCSPWPHIVLG